MVRDYRFDCLRRLSSLRSAPSERSWPYRLGAVLLSTSNEALIDHNTFGPASVPAGLPGEGRAAVTLAVYGLLCLVLSLGVFARRDIRGSE
ncbi:MAG TPA: hypothetical protein VE288_02570 [Rubrobacteraceae bacterium]|nr:hypothetical protein [Rubrobacteraceae bacterium]